MLGLGLLTSHCGQSVFPPSHSDRQMHQGCLWPYRGLGWVGFGDGWRNLFLPSPGQYPPAPGKPDLLWPFCPYVDLSSLRWSPLFPAKPVQPSQESHWGQQVGWEPGQ